MHSRRLLLQRQRADAEGTLGLRQWLWARGAKTGLNSQRSELSCLELSPPDILFLYRLSQDLCDAFHLDLLVLSWFLCVLIFGCQLIYGQRSGSTVCTLCEWKPTIHSALSVLLLNALQLHLTAVHERAWDCSVAPWPAGTELPAFVPLSSLTLKTRGLHVLWSLTQHAPKSGLTICWKCMWLRPWKNHCFSLSLLIAQCV